MTYKELPFIFAIVTMFVLAMIWYPDVWGKDVYMQLYSDQEYRASIRSLSRDARMTEEECLANKARVEKPLSVGGGYSIPSGYKVDCLPVEYLDGEPRL